MQLFTIIWTVVLFFIDTNAQSVRLTPHVADVIENGSVTLTCFYDGPESVMTSRWTYSEEPSKNPVIALVDGSCIAAGFLDNTALYGVGCHGNNTFSLRLKNVGRKHHNERWNCRHDNITSNSATIYVQVPVEDVELTQPSGNVTTVSENSTLTLTCVTSPARPGPVIYWYLQSRSSGNTTDYLLYVGNSTSASSSTIDDDFVVLASTLTLTPNKTLNGASVFCIASNVDDRQCSSRSIQLNVTYPPDGSPLIEGIVNGLYRVIEGEEGKLTCSVPSGNPSATLTWQCFDGSTNVRIADNTVKSTVTWETERKQTGGVCFCTMRQFHIRDFPTSTVLVDVLYPPLEPSVYFLFNGTNSTISSARISVTENTSFTLSCYADSRPSPHYSWRGPINASSSDVTFTDIKHHQSGSFSCHVTNFMERSDGSNYLGQNETTIHLDVLYPPEIGILDNRKAVEGEMVNITCPVINGNPANHTVTWSSDDGNVWNDQFLIIDFVTRNDSMKYTCTVNYSMEPMFGPVVAGELRKTVYIQVEYKANIKDFLVTGQEANGIVTVDENSTVKFECLVDSKPNSNLSIIFNDDVIMTKPEVQSISYLQTSLECQHSGLYLCTGENKHNKGNPSKRSIILRVRCKPCPAPDVAVQGVLYVAEHSSTILRFTAMAYPIPNQSGFRWQKLGDSGWLTLADSNNINIMTIGLVSNLTISDVTLRDYGVYRLLIENSVGVFEQIYSIKGEEEATPTIESTSYTTIIISAAVSGFCLSVAVTVAAVIKKRRGTSNTEECEDETGHEVYENVLEIKGHMYNKHKHLQKLADISQNNQECEKVRNDKTGSVHEYEDISKLALGPKYYRNKQTKTQGVCKLTNQMYESVKNKTGSFHEYEEVASVRTGRIHLDNSDYETPISTKLYENARKK